MNTDKKIAQQGKNADGAKQGRSGGSKRSRRSNKRGAKKKAERIEEA